MYRRGFAEQHPLLTAFLVTMAVGAIFKYWPFFVAVAVVAVLWLLGRRLYRAALRRRTLHAAIAARADYEHRALMNGDEWLGTFGQYQPAPWWRA